MSKTVLKDSDLEQVSGGITITNQASYNDEYFNLLACCVAELDQPIGPSVYSESEFISIKNVLDQACSAYAQSNYQEVKRLLSLLLIFLDSIKPKYTNYLNIIEDIEGKVNTVLKYIQ